MWTPHPNPSPEGEELASSHAPPVASTSLRFTLGARTLFSIPRRLIRIPLSLDEALAGQMAALPPLPADADGYLVTSLPDTAPLDPAPLLAHPRQRYRRWWIDLTDEAAWRAGLSANARAQLKRRLRAAAGYEVQRFATPDEIAAFHPLARAVSALTYQERLLNAGLPADPAPLLALAAADRARAWLLLTDGAPAAYLCCTGDGGTLRYDHVGHDPAASCAGAALLAAALADLFAEGRWARFDFTEGDGQHKRQFASAGVACIDWLLLRPTLANRVLLTALAAWDGAVARGKRVAPGVRRFGR